MTTSCPNTFHVAEHGLCVTCDAPRSVCRHCGIDVAASGADGGSWVPYPHRCVARPQGASTGPLSARMRPNSEAAPWVIEDVKRLEAENARLNAEVARAEKNLTQCREWYGQRLNELEAWFRGPGKDLPIAKQFWNILANGKADPTAPPTRYVLRAVYELLQAQNTRLREDMDDLRETLLMTRQTIGDLRNGFASFVDPARWVEQLQGVINTVLDKTTTPVSLSKRNELLIALERANAVCQSEADHPATGEGEIACVQCDLNNRVRAYLEEQS